MVMFVFGTLQFTLQLHNVLHGTETDRLSLNTFNLHVNYFILNDKNA